MGVMDVIVGRVMSVLTVEVCAESIRVNDSVDWKGNAFC